MALKVRDVMTGIPVMLRPEQTLTDAACAMRDFAVGCVLVAGKRRLHGLITDRDIVVRAIADARDPATLALSDVCSRDIAVVAPTDDLDDAVKIMRRRAVRRLPVVEDGRAVGIVSLGDLALEPEGDAASALADISAAPPNA
jgi:CBS domain-containing protein